jgi:hypothetical protein
MPTLYIIFNDMSSLGRFFSRSRFELSLMLIHSLYIDLGGEPLRVPPSNRSMIFDRAPCLPFSGGIEANALRPRGHTPLDPPDNLFSVASSCEQIVGIFTPLGELVSLHLLVAAQSRWMTASSRAIEESVVISSFFVNRMRLPHSLRSSQRGLQQPRLVIIQVERKNAQKSGLFSRFL